MSEQFENGPALDKTLRARLELEIRFLNIVTRFYDPALKGVYVCLGNPITVSLLFIVHSLIGPS